MHYYQHHIGDFLKETAGLDDAQMLAYLRMMWRYIDTEQALPNDTEVLAMQFGTSEKTIQLLLRCFFKLENNEWRHEKCDLLVNEYQELLATKSAAGKKSSEKRKAAKQSKKEQMNNLCSTDEEQVFNRCSTDVQHVLNRCSTDEQLNQETFKPENLINKDIYTSTQENETEQTVIQKPAKSGLPPAPYKQIIEIYHATLPELPRATVETEDRKKTVKKFWNWVLTSTKDDGERRAETASEAIEYCQRYFERTRDNDFVMGRTQRTGNHQNWKASIDYLLSDKGKKQIIENT